MTTYGDGRLICAVWVPGHPKTKGSMEHCGHGRMVESVDNKAWRALVTRAARDDILSRIKSRPIPAMCLPDATPTVMPVQVGLTFWLDHPDPCDPQMRAGDIDKLVRLVLDALKDAGAYLDDTQVMRVTADKLSSNGEAGNSGAVVVVQLVSEQDAALWRVRANGIRHTIRGR